MEKKTVFGLRGFLRCAVQQRPRGGAAPRRRRGERVDAAHRHGAHRGGGCGEDAWSTVEWMGKTLCYIYIFLFIVINIYIYLYLYIYFLVINGIHMEIPSAYLT